MTDIKDSVNPDRNGGRGKRRSLNPLGEKNLGLLLMRGEARNSNV